MNNKYIVLNIPKKNNIKLYRNASLDSTKSSSSKVKKIKLYKELTPFIKVTHNQYMKKIIDFPICMSLFTNNHSQNEKEIKLKLNSSSKLNIKYQGLKDSQIQNYKNNDLLLSNKKKIISRNRKGLVYSFSPLNSNIKASILNTNKQSFNSSKVIRKPLLKKINYSPFQKLTQEDLKGKQLLMNYKYYQKNINISNNSKLEQEISAIKNIKNSSMGNIPFKEKLNDNTKYMKPIYSFFSPKDINRFKNERRFGILNKNIELTNKMKEENKNSNNNPINIDIKYDVNKIFDKSEISGLTYNKSTFGSRDRFGKIIEDKKIKNLKKLNIRNKQNIINPNDSISKLFDDKEKKNQPISTIFRRNEKRRSTISVNKRKEDDKDGTNKIYPQNFMLESQKLSNIKKTKFYMTINNKKVNDIYSKNPFLHEINQILNEKSINYSINTKIFLKKNEILSNAKEKFEKLIIKENNKLKKKGPLILSIYEKQKMISIYYKDIWKNKNKIKIYNSIILSMYIKKINYKYKCNLCILLTQDILSKYEFAEMSLSQPDIKKFNKSFKKKMTFKEQKNSNFNFRTLKRVNTFDPHKKISFGNDLDDGFELRKTENNKKLELKWEKNVRNIIVIHNFILKSLPFNNEKPLIQVNHRYNTKSSQKSFHRNFSKKMGVISRISSNNFNLLKNIEKKNTINSFMKKENDLIFSPHPFIRKASTKLKMDDFRKSFKREISQKSSDSFHETLSILKQKKFFKKDKYFYLNDETTNTINDKKTDRMGSQDDFIFKNNDKDNDSELEDIYLTLVKYIIEGQNKMFKSFFEKNKEYIDINQELFEGNTLLILCAREGNLYITKFLCDENAEVNTQNNNGNTALHYAIGKQFYALADILTRHGAREDIKNAKGFAPWDCIDHNID